MSKEVNTNRGYYQPDQNISSNSYNDGSKSRSYTRYDLPGSVNPTFTKDVDMRQLSYAAMNYANNSAWSINTSDANQAPMNTREAKQAPMNTFSPYSTSSSNIGVATSLFGEGHYKYEGSGGTMQGPVSASRVVRSTYADSFVTYNINNQDPTPTLQQQTMERDTLSDIVNPMRVQNYSTQKSVPNSKISSGQSLWQNKEKNASIRVVPAVERKGRPQNPDDLRFVLYPKEKTFNVKIIDGVRIAQKVTKISYRQSLKNTILYTIGRKRGCCKKAMAESKRKRALWWVAQGKTLEEALLLCLRPYHEIYEEILNKKHSWATQMMIRNLLVQINKEGMYNPFIGRAQANDSETSDDSTDEATEEFIKTEYESNQGYPSTNSKLGMNDQASNYLNYDLNLGHNSNNLMLCSLPTQDNMQNMPTQQETRNTSSQNPSYDPKSHFLSSLADRNRPSPVNSESGSDLIHTKTDHLSPSSFADHDRQPINSKPVSKLINTMNDNPHTKVKTKTKTIKLKKCIKGKALKRYHYWLNVGKTPEEALALCFVRINKIPLYHQIKHVVGTLKNFVNTSQNQKRFRGNLSVAHTGPACIVDKAQGLQKKKKNYSSSVSSISTFQIQPTIEEDFTKDEDNVTYTRDYKTNIQTSTQRQEDNKYINNKANKQVKQATRLTNAELIRFEWWKKQGKSEEEARNLCHKSMVVSEALKHISSSTKERDVASNTCEGSKSNIPDLNQNPRREEISNKQIFEENSIKTDAMTETNFPQNIKAQEGHNIPITQNIEVPSNIKGFKQGEFRVCIKANKVNIDFDNLNAFKNSLNLCIADDADGIQIKNINKKNNRVIITCLNEQTRDWLDKQIPTLVPWENAQLEIIDEDEVPLDILARFFVPYNTEAECSSVTREQFMQQLHEQNPDVGCDRWIVHKTEMKTDPIGVYVLGCIDNKSNDVLTSKNKTLKWSDKRNIKVKLSSTKNNKSKAESGVRAVLFVPKVPECRLHSSQQYLINRLHKLNPTVGCDGWTIIQKRIKPDGAALLVRLNNASKHKVENIKKLRWYQSQNIVITIVPIYVNINFPIDNESSYLRIIPQNQITKTLINKLHFFNPSFGCLKWVVVQLQDNVDEWHLTFKINEQCHQTLIKRDYKLYWYGGRWLEIELGTVPELEMFESKKANKHSKKPSTSYQSKQPKPKENFTKNQIASESVLSPQLMVNEESKVQHASNRGLPPSIWNNPENRPDIAMLSSSRQDCTADVSYTETHQLSTAPLEYSMPDIPKYVGPPDGHGQGYLGLVGFGEKEDMAQEHYSHGVRRYDDEDRDTGLEDRYKLESNRDAYYSNTKHRNVENVNYDSDCKPYYNNLNGQEEEESRHLPHQNPDNIANPDPRSRDEYMHQDIQGYHFDQHLHDRVDTREIDYVREERKFDRGERHFDREGDFDRGDRYFDREENYLNREERNFDTEEKYYGREKMNFERGQRYLDREKSPQDGARLHLEHVRSRQETEYFQREWSPDHQNRRKRSHSRDDEWGQNLPHLWPKHREALHDSRDSLNQNKRARLSEDRRHDTHIDRIKSVYHDRGHHYQESSSYSNHKRQNSRPSFDKPPSKRKRQRR